MTRIVDSPVASEDEHAISLWFVLVKWTENGRWTVFFDDKANQFIAATEAAGLSMLAAAKKFIASQSKGNRVAAVGLRLAESVAEEI